MNVVLTTIHRLSAETVAPFFLSLRRTGFSGETVVFASDIDKASIAQLQRWGTRIESFRFRGKHVRNRLARLWPLWKLVFASPLPESAKQQLAHRVFHLFYRRHLLYLDFMKASGDRYNRFFVSDCRDVFFQRDPFAWEQSPGLHLFLEEESLRLGECSHHIRWINSQFGSETLESMRNEIISCAGTIYADRAGLLQYLQQMILLTMKAKTLREADGDQGIHNFLARKTQLPQTIIHANGAGPVLTVGRMQMSDLHLRPDRWLLNDANEVAPVIHQYDRIPELRETLLARIRDLD